MTKQAVFINGPRDNQLDDMFIQSTFYKLVEQPSLADIICFQGGPDVHPKLYGEEVLPGTYVEDHRDEEDIEVYAKYTHKPKVGICRGGQFLNVMAGGEMYQDVNNHLSGHEAINLLPITGSIYKHESYLDVTSDHHQMMIPSEEGEVLLIAHKATDFKSATENRPKPEYDVEAVWYDHVDSLCFQPHPEYNAKYQTRALFLSYMRYFF